MEESNAFALGFYQFWVVGCGPPGAGVACGGCWWLIPTPSCGHGLPAVLQEATCPLSLLLSLLGSGFASISLGAFSSSSSSTYARVKSEICLSTLPSRQEVTRR